MIFASYSQWCEILRLHTEPDAVMPCQACKGAGTITEYCGCCDNDSEKDCDVCDCQGQFIWGELSSADQENYFASTMSIKNYHDEIIATAEKLAFWGGETLQEILLNNGFVPYTKVFNRELTLKYDHT